MIICMYLILFSSSFILFLIACDIFPVAASDQTELDACTIFKLLVGTINVLWFDLFTALGVSHARLEEIREQYPYDPNPCLFQSILVWLAGESPKPSWKALADVLQFKMLQAELAKKIVRLHFSDKERAEEDRYLKGEFRRQVRGGEEMGFGKMRGLENR